MSNGILETMLREGRCKLNWSYLAHDFGVCYPGTSCLLSSNSSDNLSLIAVGLAPKWSHKCNYPEQRASRVSGGHCKSYVLSSCEPVSGLDTQPNQWI